MLTQLGQLPVGTTVQLNEDGAAKPYLIIQQGKPSSRYDDTCDGTWLLTRHPVQAGAWSPEGSNVYENSQLAQWLENQYGKYDRHIQAALHYVRIPYRSGGGLNGSNRQGSAGYPCNFFPLSSKEVGIPYTGTYAPNDGDLLAYFEEGQTDSADAKRTFTTADGKTSQWWLRSMVITNEIEACTIGPYGWISSARVTVGTYGLLYAFILDGGLWVDEDGTVLPNDVPGAPASLTVPPFAEAGVALTLSWGAAADPDGDLAGYQVQRQADGAGEWADVYSGSARTCADTPPAGAASLQYRVRAYDALGLTSGFRTSASVPVHPLTALTAPDMAVETEAVPLSWTAVSGAEGYALERKTAAADWTQVYAGTDTRYTDTAGAWTTVQYRVRAVYAGTAGAWVTGDPLPVLPRSTLTLSGQDGSLGTLTADVAFFAATDTGQPIHIGVELNGVLIDSRQVDSGARQTLPVMDLPAGTGTIRITARVDTQPQPVTQVRTWTYGKAAAAFPQAAAVVQLTRDGKDLLPLTLAEAVRAPAYLGGDLGRALETLARRPAAVRPNLLDNPYFVGGGTGWGALPVNQRGQSAYTSGYGIDRWTSISDLTLTADGITIVKTANSSLLNQKLSRDAFAQMAGRTCTLSALDTDGRIYEVSFSVPTSGDYDSPNLPIGGTAIYVDLIIQKSIYPYGMVRLVGASAEIGEGVSLAALKLELGEGQTLACQTGDGTWALLPQPDGDYQTQLSRCQSYLLVLNRAKANWVNFGQGNAYSESRCFLTVPTPVPLRATPTLAVSGELCLRNGADYPAVSSVTVYRLVENAVVLDVRGSGFTPGAQYDLMYADGAGGSLVLSAEL